MCLVPASAPRRTKGRIPDCRDAYAAQQVTSVDNRAICQHSRYCAVRIATALHADREPFLTPRGGRVDEVIRAVRDCPYGALSYAVDGRGDDGASVAHDAPGWCGQSRNTPFCRGMHWYVELCDPMPAVARRGRRRSEARESVSLAVHVRPMLRALDAVTPG